MDQEELRRLTDGETKWKKGTDEWTARLREKDVGIQVRHSEFSWRLGILRVGHLVRGSLTSVARSSPAVDVISPLQILQDEISTLNLELNHTTARNEALKKDNASLLQRWIDKMNDEVEHMNLALEVRLLPS